jgi:hypothetical protein
VFSFPFALISFSSNGKIFSSKTKLIAPRERPTVKLMSEIHFTLGSAVLPVKKNYLSLKY